MRDFVSASCSFVQAAASDFHLVRQTFMNRLLHTAPVNRGQWQSQDVSGSDDYSTYELPNVTMVISVPSTIDNLKKSFQPDLPWAEDHFQERVGRHPLNPPPSYREWPYHSRERADEFIRGGGTFDHTYPERFWPKHANPGERMQFASGRVAEVNVGIRHAYGDLDDVVALLVKEPFTRQAYLPVWFAEDTGAVDGQRVPCTLGYHFIRRGPALDCNYFIRSCDVYRHFTNDAYMAARLTQWIVQQLYSREGLIWPGNLTMHISNLHLMKGDARLAMTS